jgi:hypothetical protein
MWWRLPRLSYLRLTAVGIAPISRRLSGGLPSAVGLARRAR